MCSGSATSPTTAVPPTSSAVLRTVSAVRPVTTTWWPDLARARAVARPIPRPAPVTIDAVMDASFLVRSVEHLDDGRGGGADRSERICGACRGVDLVGGTRDEEVLDVAQPRDLADLLARRIEDADLRAHVALAVEGEHPYVVVAGVAQRAHHLVGGDPRLVVVGDH